MREWDKSRVGISLLWVILVGLFSWFHIYWLDEVRALEFARAGDSYWDMMQGVKGDGHPFLWYILLRTLAIAIGKYALPVAAFAIAAAAMAILIWKSPFSRWFLLAFVLTRLASYEFSVMARNYGISMLLMFLFAYVYCRPQPWPWRDAALTAILVILTQTNIHSVILAWMLLFHWMLEEAPDLRPATLWKAIPWTRVAILLAASFVCFLSVWPPFNDAAQIGSPVTPLLVLRVIFLPFIGFVENSVLWDKPWDEYVRECIETSAAILLLSLVFIGNWRAFLTYWLTTILMSAVFTFVYPPLLRHSCLWVSFVVTLYWINLTKEKHPFAAPLQGWRKIARRTGSIALVLALGIQISDTVGLARRRAVMPESQAANLAAYLQASPDLRHAIITANPERLLSALPYYLDNPLYAIREQRFSTLVHFSNKGGKGISLDQITDRSLAVARRHPDRPFLLISEKPVQCGGSDSYRTDYLLFTHYDAAMSRRFCTLFSAMKTFSPAMHPETYTLYRLRNRTQ